MPTPPFARTWAQSKQLVRWLPVTIIILVFAASMFAFATIGVGQGASGSCLWRGEWFSHVTNAEISLGPREGRDHSGERLVTHTVKELDVYRSTRPIRSPEPYFNWTRVKAYGCVVRKTDLQEAIPDSDAKKIYVEAIATTPAGEMVKLVRYYDDLHWHITGFGFFPIEATWYQVWSSWTFTPLLAISLFSSA